ncbi:hypothetical protein B0T19DRAFT_41032 [Cercophora scortea]|uniref:Uncharacterized protein n=1 Tax=Cercophora scortea TaxID=314031 RepID=A0AAE0J4P0_9PEZI|nr:hypothetical protein B0T19DRAFT_41032 [Cercophora scortea]
MMEPEFHSKKPSLGSDIVKARLGGLDMRCRNTIAQCAAVLWTRRLVPGKYIRQEGPPWCDRPPSGMQVHRWIPSSITYLSTSYPLGTPIGLNRPPVLGARFELQSFIRASLGGVLHCGSPPSGRSRKSVCSQRLNRSRLKLDRHHGTGAPGLFMERRVDGSSSFDLGPIPLTNTSHFAFHDQSPDLWNTPHGELARPHMLYGWWVWGTGPGKHWTIHVCQSQGDREWWVRVGIASHWLLLRMHIP